MKKAVTFLSTFLYAAIIFLHTSLLEAQEIGLQLYSLREQFKTDVPGTLKLISDWGITFVEGGDSYGLPVEEFKELLNKHKIQVVSVGATFEELKDNPRKVVERAKTYGASYVMCAWIPHTGNTFGIKETQMALSVFNRAGKIFREYGLELAYHAHGYEFRPYRNGILFDHLADKAQYFSFEMDVFWVQHAGEDPLQLLKKYPEKFVLMHLKDMAKGTPKDNTGHADVEANVVLGTGEVNIGALVAEAKKIGIKYLFIEDESSRVTDQVPQSLTYLKSL
ncbi:sugar phosphate isomerase/epimerase family protein [Sediminicola sp. 1XM1-17]|uniref:sugar phosphate isomerase/epimerase family protein n=1 Tax=Sediminicola sp. 1XM1-17 TaxID=3127702 RepID=UPI0030781B67